jgi:hypothetical protein
MADEAGEASRSNFIRVLGSSVQGQQRAIAREMYSRGVERDATS